MTSVGVGLSGDMRITGRPGVTTITAKTSGTRRHFVVGSSRPLTANAEMVYRNTNTFL